MADRTWKLSLGLVILTMFVFLAGCSHKYEDETTGITVRDLGSDLNNHWAFQGVVVEAVRPGSPADGRIGVGELISYIMGEKKVTNEKEFNKSLKSALEEDKRATLKVLKTISVSGIDELGVGVKPSPAVQGVVVSQVVPGKAGEKAGIKLSTVVYELNGKPVKTVDDYDRILTEAFSGGNKVTFGVMRHIVASKLSNVGIQEMQAQNGAVVIKKLEKEKSEKNLAYMEGLKEGDIITHVIDEAKVTDIKKYKKAIKMAMNADRVIFKRGELGAIKLVVINALGQIGDVRAMNSFLTSLESEDKWLRRAAAAALAKMGDERAVKPLMRHLLEKDEPDPEVRYSAAAGLARMRSLESIDYLAQALKDSTLSVRLEAGYALGRIGKPAIGVLIKARYDQDGKVRDSAVAALGSIGGVQARNELINVLRDKKEEPTVKLTAIQALYKMGDPESIAELERVAKSGDPDLKAFVKELLGEENVS